MKCLFCMAGTEITEKRQQGKIRYDCVRCGHVYATEESEEAIYSEEFSQEQRLMMSIYLRNQQENLGRKRHFDLLTTEMLHTIIENTGKLDPVEQMERALLNLNRKSKHVGHGIEVKFEVDYPFYYCSSEEEAKGLFHLLVENNFIDLNFLENLFSEVVAIKSNGYRFIKELNARRTDLRQCFVAMWFTPEMNRVWNVAIKPAIEYIEEEQSEPRFKAIKADTEEYVNDINDWILSEIRRSRFMVCDLTGYRGGIYFEAGFAYGLGLPVIYTCRKDWCEPFKEANGKVVREGVHFDLNHQNRIEWEQNDLQGFKTRLMNRIKAIIL